MRVRAVSPAVLRADMGILPAMDMAALAHARHRARTLRADAAVLGDSVTPGVDPAAHASRVAADAPDIMGAAVRSAASAWGARADRALRDALRWCPGSASACPGAASVDPVADARGQADAPVLAPPAPPLQPVSNLQLRLGIAPRSLRGRGVGETTPDTGPAVAGSPARRVADATPLRPGAPRGGPRHPP